MRDGVITLEGPVGNFTKEMLIQGLLPNDAQGAQQAEKAYVPVDYAHLKPVMQVKDFSGYGGNVDAATQVGKNIAKKALEKGISEVVFDRGGFVYHGRVKAVAEGAREGGLKL